jgi:phenylalanyl-tRNA synthetase beta chain
MKGDLDQIGELGGGLIWKNESSGWQNAARGGAFALPKNGNGEPRLIGHAGQLAARAADEFKLRQDVFLAEWALDPFLIACVQARAARKYQPISRFPAVERDFSLILHDGTGFAAVRAAVASLGIAEIISIEAMDLFRGRNITPGSFSLLVRVTFQSREGTLSEAQLSDFSSRIISALETVLGATLRTA